MGMPFMLRFQEVLYLTHRRDDTEGTQTHTFVRSEQADTDSHHFRFRSIPLDTKRHESMIPPSGVAKVFLSGTQTATEVRQETADRDPANRSFSFIPKESTQ